MVSFQLTEDQKEMQELFRKFAQDKVAKRHPFLG